MIDSCRSRLRLLLVCYLKLQQESLVYNLLQQFSTITLLIALHTVSSEQMASLKVDEFVEYVTIPKFRDRNQAV